MERMEYLPGTKFNKLTLLEEIRGIIGKDGRIRRYGKFKCDCGTIKNIRLDTVTSGEVKGCRCLWITHKMTDTKFYSIWSQIVQRCTNPNATGYKHYGGMGITICNEWLKFEKFRDDLYKDYLKHVEEFGENNTSLDRRDGNKGYLLNNCRWATWEEQANNKLDNHKINYQGMTKTLTEWARYLNMKPGTLSSRLIDCNWSIEDAFTIKINGRKSTHHLLTYNNETKNIAEWAKELGIKAPTLLRRIRKGWSLEKAFNAKVNKNEDRFITYNNETRRLAEWAKILNMGKATLSARINNPKWSLEKAFTTPAHDYKRRDV